MDREQGEITRLLAQIRNGHPEMQNRLLELLYDELHRIAAARFSGEDNNLTLGPTALVHEAYLHLIAQNVEWQNRAHFFSIAARIMRRILVDHARARRALKRGGLSKAEDLTAAAGQVSLDDILALNEALDHLEVFAKRQSQVVELHFFGGLTMDETAQILDIDRRTVQRDWKLARAWLHSQMRKPEHD